MTDATDVPNYMQSERTKERMAYQENVGAELARWQADLTMLEAKLKEAGAAASMELDEKAIVLQARIEDAKEKLEVLKDATDQAWEETQKDLEALRQELDQEIEALHQKSPVD